MSNLFRTFELVHQAQGGESEAFNSLVARYYPRVLKIVRLRMGKRLRLRMESGDLLQETFARAIQNFNRFEMRDERSLINWLARLTENTVSDAVKREQAQKRSLDKEAPLEGTGEDHTPGILDTTPDRGWAIPLDQLIQAEEESVLEHGIQKMSDDLRELIILRNYLGLSFGEIAREIGSEDEGAARLVHAKAMRELTKLLKRPS